MKKNNFQILQFFPLLNWPSSLPSILIGDRLVAGFDSLELQTFHQLDYESAEKASQQFFEIHPLLTLPEIFRVIEHPLASDWLNPDRLIQNYGFYPSPDFYKISQLITQLPFDFQNWVGMKKLGISELVPLLSLDIESANQIAQSITQLSDSKSEAAQRIEWLVDLTLMKQPLQNLLNLPLKQLKSLRFPETNKRDDNLKNIQLPWTSPIKSKLHRKGDSAGFDIQFFASSPVELEKIADTLKKVASSWNSNLQ